MKKSVNVGNVIIGDSRFIPVQTMTNTDTRDVSATLAQIDRLSRAGADLVRVTVQDDEAALAFKEIVQGTDVPLIADFHFDARVAIKAIEAGAKNGIFPVDEKTMAYAKEHSTKTPVVYEADADAEYDEVYTIDLSTMKPTVAFPHLPENTKTIDAAGEVVIDQVVIGSCTNGRLNDMKIAADILNGKQVHPKVRTIIIPATQQIYLDCIRLGYAETFVKAGAVFSTPTCGPCLGGHMGILAAGERCVSTTNRNFVGRMGHTESEVYLASPAVAAASAIAGYIADPEEITGGMKA